jgi:hypothetical protein
MTRTATVSPLTLHDGASKILACSPASVAFRRACAIVARQAIEATVHEALGIIDDPRINWRSRFLLLETEFKRPDARHGYLLWRTWSDHAHYHAYDLTPDAPALTELLVTTRSWITGLGSSTPTTAQSTGRSNGSTAKESTPEVRSD